MRAGWMWHCLSWSVVPAILLGTALDCPGQQLTVSSVTARRGDTVLLPIQYAAGPDATALQFDLTFDPTRFTPRLALTGDAFGRTHKLNTNIVTSGLLRIVITSTRNEPLSTGMLATVPFSVDWKAPPGSSPVTVSDALLCARSGMLVLSLVVEQGRIDVLVPELGGVPDGLYFTYCIDRKRLLPSSIEVTPRNIGSPDSLDWSATVEGDWLRISPISGTTPSPFYVVPTGFDASGPRAYSGKFVLTVTNPADVIGVPRDVPVTLDVVEVCPGTVCLPLVIHANR